jgi:hypothetical protein
LGKSLGEFMKISYTYIIKFPSIDKFYYGVRSIARGVLPEDDLGIKYKSSSKSVIKMIKLGMKVEYYVHRVFDDADSGFKYEGRVLKTIKKLKKVKSKCLNQLFGSISHGCNASPNAGKRIVYDYEFRSVRFNNDERIPSHLLEKRDVLRIRGQISDFIHNTLFPIEYYPENVRNYFFKSISAGIRRSVLANSYPLLKELYTKLNYKLNDLEFIREFLAFRRFSVKDVILAKSDRMIRIIGILKLENEWNLVLDELYNIFGKITIDAIESKRNVILAKRLNLCGSRITQLISSDYKKYIERIYILQKTPIKPSTYMTISLQTLSFDWMYDKLLLLKDLYVYIEDPEENSEGIYC